MLLMGSSANILKVYNTERAMIFSGAWTSQVDRLAASFQAGRPFAHVVIDGFLRESFCGKLIGEFPPYDERFMRSHGGKAEHPQLASLGPAFRAFDEVVGSPAFLGLLAQMTGIAGLAHDPLYVGGGAHEILDGMDNSIHLDFNRLPDGSHRRLNVFLYLNPGWRPEWGGLLQLHSDPLSPWKN